MKIEITPTNRLQSVGGTAMRTWEGVTDKGVYVRVFVALVQVDASADQAAFEQELQAVGVSRDLVSFDMRLAL